MALEVNFAINIGHETQPARQLANKIVSRLTQRGDPMPIVDRKIDPDDPAKSILRVTTHVRGLTTDILAEIVKDVCKECGIEKL